MAAKLFSEADEAALQSLVGVQAVTRGRLYAQRGAVIDSVWAADGLKVAGRVRGTDRQPYRASVVLTRTERGALGAISGICSCPVGYNCKHVVALLLSGAASAPGGAGDAKQTSEQAGWEAPLTLLLDEGNTADPDFDIELGLLFELSLQPAIHVRVQLITPGKTAPWVKGNTTWSKLDFYSYGRRKPKATLEAVELMIEMRALTRLSGTQRQYSMSEEAVWLESINSRRVWDLLVQAEDLGMPLVSSTRPLRPVALHRFAAQATLDLTRVEGGVQVRPTINVSGQAIELASSLLVGEPAHGVVWWPPDPAIEGKLHLAPLSEALGTRMRSLIYQPPVRIPAADEARFLGQFYPRLHRSLPLRSSDDSVILPDVSPATLLLAIHHGEGQRLDLEWSTGALDRSWREPLAPGGLPSHEQALAHAVESATSALLGFPALLATSPAGPRLTPSATLTGLEAAIFMTTAMPALAAIDGLVIEQSGLAPNYRETLDAPRVRIGGNTSPNGDWFDLSVEVSVGGESVPFQDLFVALAEEQSHLVLPSGAYFALDRRELRQLSELIAEARALPESTDVVRLSRFHASLWDDFEQTGDLAESAAEWAASVRNLTEAQTIQSPTPSTLHATLRPYQQAGFNWLVFLFTNNLGGVLADDMGLGKTLQALALICHAHQERLTIHPFLVVAPTSVVGNWAAECERFAPGLRSVTITETARRRGSALKELTSGASIVITSYALFRIDYEDYAATEWAGMFLDEAQFAKNPASHTYRRARSLPTRFKIAMTGTPLENNLMELWALLSITAPGLFPRSERFSSQYRIPIEKHGDAERLDQLRRRIRPIMLRRTKDQVAPELPDKQEQEMLLDLNAKHKRIYDQYLHRERQKVLGLLGDMTKNRFEIFRSLTLLRQAALAVSLVDDEHAHVPSTKLDVLVDMLSDIVADGHRVLVFSQFTRFLDQARRRVSESGIDHCYLDGSTRRRAEVITRFRQGDTPVFFVSLKAGGFGLNLTEADYCILLDPWWNPAAEAQAVDRVHRIGQTKKVMVYRLVANGTIEEKVMALKAKKATLFANVIDGGGFDSVGLSAADIRELLD